ncbi:MAG: adenylate/guanylate cyclase domain-containing protein [Deltaproteobacteria bacterium]|nr:MAG: adenylate/guanylate cyclase domain-containing protein [Deltaproteobacteria bacterium]
MSFEDDLKKEVRSFFRTQWEVTDGKVIPEPDSIGLGNKAKKLDIAILYADMAESTNLVDGYKPLYAAEIYKSFLHTCCKIIRRNGGELVSFDGDRIMGAFIGDGKNSAAAKCALNIKWGITSIVQSEHDEYYKGKGITINYSAGIDSGDHHVIRTGIRGGNDLVWVGKAANYAAKLSNHNWSPYHSIISNRVYSKLNDGSKYDGDGKNMWIQEYSNEINESVYKSSYHWKAT